jgi:serine/threonine-protein kinase
VCPAISDALVSILDTCLAHDPVDRYASAKELEQALSQALDELGLTDGEAILAAFFADPAATRGALVQRLVATLLAKGAEEAAAGRLPRALARVDQALALEPEAPAARALLDRLQSTLRRGRARRRAVTIAGGTVIAAALAVGVTAVVRSRMAGPEAPPPGPAMLSAASAPSRPPAPVVPASVETPTEPPQEGVLPGAAAPTEGAAETSRSARTAPRPAAVRYQVLVRPYGSLQVDDEKKSSEALSVHTLALSPGRHVLRVSCQWCEDQVVPIEVIAGKPETLAIPARLKAAELRFAFEPASAQVRIGDVTRAAGESLSHPFEIASPRAPTRFVHRVDYEVTAPGFRPVRSSVEILPGAVRTLTGRLVPE